MLKVKSGLYVEIGLDDLFPGKVATLTGSPNNDYIGSLVQFYNGDLIILGEDDGWTNIYSMSIEAKKKFKMIILPKGTGIIVD